MFGVSFFFGIGRLRVQPPKVEYWMMSFTEGVTELPAHLVFARFGASQSTHDLPATVRSARQTWLWVRLNPHV